MNKRIQVVMLPTNEKANVAFTMFSNKLSESKQVYGDGIGQHLCFLLDEKPKDGDWIYVKILNQIIKFDKNSPSIEGCKKIIATTDSSLKIKSEQAGENAWYNPLPQPSQDFIKVFVEEYNKGNVIEWVDVGYNKFFTDKDNHFLGENRLERYKKSGAVIIHNLQLKVNSQNEITIKMIKDSYTREEVVKLLNKLSDDILEEIDGNFSKYDEWISKNL